MSKESDHSLHNVTPTLLIDQQGSLLVMSFKKRSYEYEVDLKKLSVILAPE
ncbi:hypothetical protein [Xenorhabdus littoralis]|uniref:hypothetical protein n=1 Tax=Xenorhabdus littoralis TaxID=2582835 RepID=UPI0029E82485|nr:hypothetical protein [Xenorhabdus sp. Reich]